LSETLIDPITQTSKINLNGLLAIHQDIQVLQETDKKHESVDLQSVNDLLLLIVDESDKRIQSVLTAKTFAEDDEEQK